MSMVSAGSYQARCSVLAGQADGSVLSWQSTNALLGRRRDGTLDPMVVGAMAGAATAVIGIAWLVVRRS
jgi:hypothetical protein